MANPVSQVHKGWHWSDDDARLNFYYNGTRCGHITATTIVAAAAISDLGTITSGTATTVTTGNTTNSAGDFRVTAGNFRLGAVSAFATAEPTSAIVCKVGTAPVGAIATSSGFFTDGTSMLKIVAGGTADNIET